MLQDRRAELVFSVVLAPTLLVLGCRGESPVGVTQRTFVDDAFETVVEEDIVYGRGAVRSPEKGEVDLLLDLYRPTGDDVPESRPGLVVIHGGGFTTGSRKNSTASGIATSYAERGYVTVSIEYRLMGDDPPAEEHATDSTDARSVAAAAARIDAARAVQWLREHADDYGIDPTRVAVAGYSAGAITALGMALRDEGPDAADVGAVISLAGVLYEEESIVDAGDPPLVLVNGVEDGSVPIEVAEAIAARASEVGLTHEFYALDGVGHEVPKELDTLVDGVRVSDRIASFLHDQLGLDELTEASP